MDAQVQFAKLRAVGGPVDPSDLDALWASLPVQQVDDMLGAWRGGEFDTGHPLNGKLGLARWVGKHFVTPDNVKPLVCLGEDGKPYSNTMLGKGEASLWPVAFRGETTASMVYDGQPVIDHFKRVDEHTVMGIMNGKADRARGAWFYFWLERDDSVAVG